MKKKKNYMDFVPAHNPEYTWKKKENERVEVAVVNKGFYNRIAQIFFKRPAISYIELDEYGSYLWQQIDGKKDIYLLSKKMQEHFGEKAEPVVERLVKFMKTLQVNHYIYYVSTAKDK